MNYTVRRGVETFGPYSLGDLQKYFQEGRVLGGDFTKSEGMTDWVPVSQVLGNIPMAASTTVGFSAAPAEDLVSLPPNLHWAILLVLNIITRQFFNWIWAFVLANWARKLSGDNKALVLVAMYPAGFLAAMVCGAAGAAGMGLDKATIGILALVFVLGGLIAYTFGIFQIRDAMQDYYTTRENVGLQLSGVMTFFFSTVYLQYHVNSLARWKKTGVYT